MIISPGRHIAAHCKMLSFCTSKLLSSYLYLKLSFWEHKPCYEKKISSTWSYPCSRQGYKTVKYTYSTLQIYKIHIAVNIQRFQIFTVKSALKYKHSKLIIIELQLWLYLNVLTEPAQSIWTATLSRGSTSLSCRLHGHIIEYSC